MNTYQIFTQCGVMTRYDANNSYLAANQAREDGWVVVAVIRIK
jgi:hypothetical protein